MMNVDYETVRRDITAAMYNPEWADEGFLGPLFLRLAWHSSGTYSKKNESGGSNGATMRFSPEKDDPDNAGLEWARHFLEPIKKMHPVISYADLWTLAGVVAVETMGGNKVSWNPGRADKNDEECGLYRTDSKFEDSFTKNFIVPEPGLLPMASGNYGHVRAVFQRMGFTDQETVALIGSHCVGKCHYKRSGYEGQWTETPTIFCNSYFKSLLERDWKLSTINGIQQHRDPNDEEGKLLMLTTDLALLKDAKYRAFVEMYANDNDLWMKDFSDAFAKLLELGMKRK